MDLEGMVRKRWRALLRGNRLGLGGLATANVLIFLLSDITNDTQDFNYTGTLNLICTLWTTISSINARVNLFKR